MSSHYEGLPIYRTAADLAVHVDRAVREFPGFHKYTIGTRLRESSHDILLLVAKANDKASRALVLADLCRKAENLKILLNAGRELAVFQSLKQFMQLMERVVSLAIRDFLAQQLKLEAHPVELQRVSDGIDFVGYIVRPQYLLPRRRVVVNLRQKVRTLEAQLTPRSIAAGSSLRIDPLPALTGPVRAWAINEFHNDSLRASWASYLGHFVHARATRLVDSLWKQHEVSARLLIRKGDRLTLRFKSPRAPRNYGEQVSMLAAGIGDAVLLVQVGRYLECPRLRDAARTGLKFGPCGKRRVAAGVPLAQGTALIRSLLDDGHDVALAIETPAHAGAVRTRAIRWFLRHNPQGASHETTRNTSVDSICGGPAGTH